MEKLKNKSPYIFIAVASLSFIVFFIKRKFRLLVISEEQKARIIREAVDDIRKEQRNKLGQDISSIIQQGRTERIGKITNFSKYGHGHK